jgi:hypothetical protein
MKSRFTIPLSALLSATFLLAVAPTANAAGSTNHGAATASGLPALEASLQQSLRASDLMSRHDVTRTRDGHMLDVPNVGKVAVMAIRPARSGQKCQVHTQSLIDAIAADPPSSGQQKWLRLTIYDAGELGLICLGPLGGGCYILINRT